MTGVRFFLQKTSNGNQVALTGVVSVGRSTESALKLTEGRPSRNHARITIREGSAWIEDLGSTNGTFVNDVRIQAQVKLSHEDRVRFDIEDFVFRTDPPPDADRTAVRDTAPRLPAEALPPKVKPPEVKPPEVKTPPAVVAESARPNLPPVWTLDGSSGGNKTVFKSIEEMEAERQAARASIPDMASVEAPDVPQLVVVGSGESLIFQLRGSGNQKEWIVGSDAGREIRIERSGVSGLHAKIVNAGKLWKVVDQVSQNGTFVNGKRSMTSYLRSGDRIAFGSVECVFRLPHDSGAGSSVKSSVTTRRPRGKGFPAAKIVIVAVLSFLATVAVLIALLTWLG